MSTIAEEIRSLTKAVESGGGGEPTNWYKSFTLDKLSDLHTHYDDFVDGAVGVMLVDIESMDLSSAPIPFHAFRDGGDVLICAGTNSVTTGASFFYLITSGSTELLCGQIGSYQGSGDDRLYGAQVVGLDELDLLTSNIHIFVTNALN